MNAADTNIPAGEGSPLALNTASKLMRLGISRSRRPVDDLIDRLREPDAAEWLDTALRSGPIPDDGAPVALLVEGTATAEDLVSLTERSKALLRTAGAGSQRLPGVAGYFLSIAAALRHHGVLITDRSRDELDPVLLDLAEAAPAPYGDMLSAATLAETG